MDMKSLPNSERQRLKRGLTVLECSILISIVLLLAVLLMPSPRVEYHCSKCGNLIRDERWMSVVQSEKVCLTAWSPITPECMHPAFSPHTPTSYSQIVDAWDFHSKRLDRGIDVIVAYFR